MAGGFAPAMLFINLYITIMEFLSVSQQVRVHVIRCLLKQICRAYSLYFSTRLSISEYPSHASDSYVLWLHCYDDCARAAAFLLLRKLINETVLLDGDIIKIEVPAEHRCLNPYFSETEASNPNYEWKADML